MRRDEGEEPGGFVNLRTVGGIGYDGETVAIGYDGGSYLFVIDLRTDPPTYRALPMDNDEDDVLTLGTTFEQMLARGRAGLLGPQPRSA